MDPGGISHRINGGRSRGTDVFGQNGAQALMQERRNASFTANRMPGSSTRAANSRARPPGHAGAPASLGLGAVGRTSSPVRHIGQNGRSGSAGRNLNGSSSGYGHPRGNASRYGSTGGVG